MRSLFIILSSILIFTSCEKDEIVGPDYDSVKNGDLVITQSLSVSSGTVDFSNGEQVTFNAELENDKEWVLTLTGGTSGATRTVTGVGREISFTWDGTTGNVLPLFTTESITATLSFPDHTGTTETVNVTVSGERDIDAGGVLVSDFTIANIVTWGLPGWESDYPPTVNSNTDYPYPDGTPYLYTLSAPQTTTSPYADITFLPAKYTDPGTDLYPLYADPARVYFNIFVYYDPTYPETWLEFQMVESSGATYTHTLRPSEPGWNLLTVRYDQFVGTGNHNPTQLETIGVVLLSDEDPVGTEQVLMAIDHPIFTFDAPLSF